MTVANSADILIKDVAYTYPKGGFSVGANLSLDNRFTVIKGKNGSGKTTLGKLIAGLLTPDSGDIFLYGKLLRDLKLHEIGAIIGYLFQNPSHQLFAATPAEEISFILRLKGLREEDINIIMEEALKRFQLFHLKHRNAFRLSRGEKQALAMAAVLVNKPQFLVFDEPTTGLDLNRRELLSNTFQSLTEEGIGIVVITHDSRLISRHAKRIITMDRGHITYDES